MQLDVDIEPALRFPGMISIQTNRWTRVKALPCNGLTNKEIKCLRLDHDHVMLLRQAHLNHGCQTERTMHYEIERTMHYEIFIVI